VITVQNKDLGTYDFSYGEKSVPQGTASDSSPTTEAFPATAKVRYTVSPSLPNGMILDADTGEISIADSTAVQAGIDYTVTATPTGTGYTGTKTAVAKIEITASDVSTLAFSYDDTSVVFGWACCYCISRFCHHCRGFQNTHISCY
jgi:hypothetical protein